MNRNELAEDTLHRYCLPLVQRIRDEKPDDWGPWLEAIPADRVRVMAVLLAALVPVDEPLSDLTAWIHNEPVLPVEVESVVAALTAWLARGIDAPMENSIEIDGHVVDVVAVRRALRGEGTRLSTAERRFAVLVGTRAGLSSADIAQRIVTTQRTVVRIRSSLRCGRKEVAA